MPTSSAPKRLVIVESPAKAKTIKGYLGQGYEVEASVGHIRDLAAKQELPEEVRKEPWARLAVNTEDGFTPYYSVSAEKKRKVSELKAALKSADELLLATDEDREGEAIAWHLMEVLKPKVPVRRMVFNEITKDAIQQAAENTRDLDMELVDAQETRRIVDRLYGFEVSEVVWRKIGRNAKSAGRVQSVAVRMVVERERERIAFVSASYADIVGTFSPAGLEQRFTAKLVAVDGAKLATGADFDDRGNLKSKATALSFADAESLAAGLQGAQFSVRSVEEKPKTSRPSAPFMTSSLQQEASRKFGWNAQRTMRVAQSLYENGWITYMRTDSTSLSATALTAARNQAVALYGPDSIPSAPRTYDRKVKNAQEAHEAIRPSGETFRTPKQAQASIGGDDLKLYDLIWKRTVASQMVDARGMTTTVRFGAVAADGRDAEFSVSGTVWTTLGYMAAYREGSDEEAAEGDEVTLPAMARGDSLVAHALEAKDHSTNPPARYTEASLVKAMEERGIGRPSTYAAIMTKIVDAGYVWKKGSALVPSWTAFSVTRLMEEQFGQLVDYGFTAAMEEQLDEISNGSLERLTALEAFYRGNDHLPNFPGLVDLISGAIEGADPRALGTFPIPGSDISVRVGKFGPYLERGEAKAGVPDDLPPDELTPAKAEELLNAPSSDRELGIHPETGLPVLVKTGRFGPYVEEALPEGAKKSDKPRRASLFKDMTAASMTIYEAVRLLGLPRVVGSDPETGIEITAQNGKFGPYIGRIVEGKLDARSLVDEESIFSVSLEEALALFAQPRTRRGQRPAAGPLRELGADPVSGGVITVRDGRFGPYVTDGEYNATLRKGDDPQTITPERAVELLADKRAKGPAPKKKAAAKKTTAKKTAAKKTTAKKTTAKTAAAKTTAKKTAAKTTAAKTTAAKTTAAKTTAKKTAAKKTVAEEPAAPPVSSGV